MEAITVETRGLTFTGFTGGPSMGSPVLLMHGFPQLASAWRPVAERLVAAGCRIVALDARGYSPGARPSSIDDYAMGHLVDDVVGWLDALGWERCDLVGHDFGAAVGWHVAAHHPERVRTWSALSVPHQGAFLAVRDRDPDQTRKSGYMTMFREDPDGVAESFLADGGARMAKMYGGDVPDEQVREYIRRHSEPRAFLSAVYWYCAMGRESLPAMCPVPASVPV